MLRYLLLNFFVLCAVSAFGQRAGVRFLSVSSDNDYYYWFGYSNDRYYTAGNSLTYGFGAQTKSKAVKFVFPSLYDSTPSIFSFRLFQQIDTPTYLNTTRLQTTDYPFAAALYLTVSRNTVSKSGYKRWKTDLDFGVIGPAADGQQSQSYSHSIVQSPQPLGWVNQVPSQLILNYHAEFEKNIFSALQNKFVNAITHAAFGTMNTYLQFGFTGSVSNRKNLIWSDFSLWPQKRQWTFFLSSAPMVRIVVWNGMLEGMPLQEHTHYYKVTSAEITRMLPMFVLKVAIARGRHFLMGQQTFLGREFHSVDPQVYGTITYTYRFDKGGG